MQHACLPPDYEKIIDTIIKANPDKWKQACDDHRLLGWFIGQAFKESRGKINPTYTTELLKARTNLYHEGQGI